MEVDEVYSNIVILCCYYCPLRALQCANYYQYYIFVYLATKMCYGGLILILSSFIICIATNYAILTGPTVLSHYLILCHSTLYYECCSVACLLSLAL